MSGINFFGFNLSKVHGSYELPDIFPLPIAQNVFVPTDVQAVYSKILTDVIERTQGIPEDAQTALWDNCLQSEAGDGLITLLSKAMEGKTRLFLVWRNGVLRKAQSDEQAKIEEAYAQNRPDSAPGIFINFQKYTRTDMVKLYSALEYCVIGSLYKNMNLSKAIQLKVEGLRSSVALTDSDKAKSQAKDVANALAAGKDALLDSKDLIETHEPSLDATEKSIEFLDSKRCFYLGLPRSYVNGETGKGLGDSGEGDAKAVERGLKTYFFSIIKPVVEALFGASVTFKSQDFRMITVALDALKTFELTSDRFISDENKLLVMNTLLEVDSELGAEPEPLPAPGPAPVPGKEPDPAPKPKAE